MNVSLPSSTMSLSAQELQVCQRLIAAFPEPVAPDDIINRAMYAPGGDPGDPLDHPTSQVCRIRGLLGRGAIETVYQTRVNRLGRLVRLRNRPCVGYKAGPVLMGITGFHRVTSSSETHAEVSSTEDKGPAAKTLLRGAGHFGVRTSPEPHRNCGLRVMAQLEAACREAINR